jgi:pimeloyl-ACP methyl ester carboxylesterase
MAPAAVMRIFAPSPVPERFRRAYSMPHALRPSQMQAVAEEAAMLNEVAGSLSRRYEELSLPVSLIAGSEDGIVNTREHSERLHRELATSSLRRIPGCGHMVHHAAPDEVVGAIRAIANGRPMLRVSRRAPAVPKPALRQWLHIGESYEGHLAAVGA